MITEDYVSFKIAKLLKEKGFDWEVHRSYLVNDNCFAPADINDLPYRKDAIRIPTLQMVMKWLREKHHLHIEIRITNHSMSDMVNIVKYYWVMTNTETGRWCDESTVYTVKGFDKSEEAEEDAIRNALENLI